MSSEGKDRLAALGLHVPELLLPAEGVDLTRFSVVACDQHSAEPEYWERVRETVGDAPSSLKLILPEAWLQNSNEHKAAIGPTMERYLQDGTLRSIGEGMVFLHRRCSTGLRRGLVVAFDLEQYDYRSGAKSLLRPTEQTVIERLPARLAVRREAPIELPHVMVLYNDPEDMLMNALEQQSRGKTPLYDFELMEQGGAVTGWQLRDEADYALLADCLEKLRAKALDDMLFAMGDGNHSFAAAKLRWEEVKLTIDPDQWNDHPARYALCELVNLYDPGLYFEPIHRLLIGVSRAGVCRDLKLDPLAPPPLQELQPRLDSWLKDHPEAELEYIHGADECRQLGQKSDCLAIIWDRFDREGLFPWVAAHGPLCRKSFSMGHAADKRYYLEARKIR